ncbi:MAG: TonB family protein [Betaproteobacteria bacterium]|nr:TonB family protein [Betaproteobacteria bacterium]
MPAYFQQRRLYLSLAASLLFHAALLGSGDLALLFAPQWVKAVPAVLQVPVLQAYLLPIPNTAELLKNTLSEEKAEVLALSPRPAARPAGTMPQAPREESAERKLAEHLFYPPEAIASGLQGEVRLLLLLDAEGGVIDAQIASSSGHDLLDQAAIAAAHAMRRLPDTGVRELILPVVFKLQ